MEATTALLLVHAGATLFMTAVVWVIQLVHYPLMRYVEDGRFPRFERAHQQRISLIVTPMMLVEAGCAALLLFMPDIPKPLAAGGLGFLAGIWLSTFLVQVPCHDRLLTGRCDRTIDRLVRTNWLRTVLWSLRSALALYLLVACAMGPG